MGTSKGYIAPTTIYWSKSKRAVTGFIKNGDNDSKIKAASRFAEAMNQDISSSASFISATGKILSFINNASSIGLNNALQQIDRLDLIDKEPGEVLDALLNHFTNNGNTVEDYLAAQAIGEAFSNLKIENIADINNISTEAFLIEVLVDFEFLDLLGTLDFFNEVAVDFIFSASYTTMDFSSLDALLV